MRQIGEPPPAVVHVDLDGAAHIFANNGWRYKGSDDPLFRSGMDGLLSFLDENGIKATLFVIAEDMRIPEKAGLIREAVRRGHEIASHSLTHPKLFKLSPKSKRKEIDESRKILEDELGTPVSGFRAPSYSIDRQCIEFLQECGYAWDSSTFPTPEFARKLGIAVASSRPYRPLPGSDLLELPLPGHRPGPFPFHPCYTLIVGQAYFHWRLRAFHRSRDPLIWLFHLTDFADPLSRDQLCGLKSKLLTLSHLSAETKRERCTAMLRAVRSRYYLTTTECALRMPGGGG